MRYCAGLHRLPFTVKEGPAQAVVAFIANGRAAVPEFLGISLIGHIDQHPYDLAVLDLVIKLAAKLEVVALLIYRERTIANDVNTLLYFADHLGDA